MKKIIILLKKILKVRFKLDNEHYLGQENKFNEFNR